MLVLVALTVASASGVRFSAAGSAADEAASVTNDPKSVSSSSSSLLSRSRSIYKPQTGKRLVSMGHDVQKELQCKEVQLSQMTKRLKALARCGRAGRREI